MVVGDISHSFHKFKGALWACGSMSEMNKVAPSVLLSYLCSLFLSSRHGLSHLWKEDTGSSGLLGLLWCSGSEVPEMLSDETDKSKVWILQPCTQREWACSWLVATHCCPHSLPETRERHHQHTGTAPLESWPQRACKRGTMLQRMCGPSADSLDFGEKEKMHSVHSGKCPLQLTTT